MACDCMGFLGQKKWHQPGGADAIAVLLNGCDMMTA